MAEGSISRGARRRGIPEGERRKVWVRSGGRCAVCNADLMEGRLTRREFALGDLAHIVGQHQTAGSPRGLTDLPEDERDKADNLMLICKGEHAEIDRAGSLDVMTVEKLRKLKRDHEDRIRYLTGLAPNQSTVVLRMVGRVRGNAVELTRDSATTAILRSSNRFPDYRLCLDRHGIEIDLRQLPGEPVADHRYYSAAKAAIDEVIDHKLVEGVVRENIAHLSVFAFARIPLLVYLGSRLDDTIPTEIYQRHRAGETWEWPQTAEASDFLVQSPTSLAGASEAVLVLNVSGTIQPQELPANLLDLPTFLFQPDGELPQPDVMASRKTLQAFETKARSLLSGMEAAGKSVRRLHVFPALSLSAAIVLGRVVDPHVHPTLVMYDRTTSGYQPALEIR